MDPVPILLERDYNFEELDELQAELMYLKTLIAKHWRVEHETQ